MRAVGTLSAILFAALLLAACGGTGGGDDREPMLVMAAASLTDVFSAIEVDFEAANPAIDVQLNLAGSSALREQILQGAPADVFAAANESTMAQVVAAGDAESSATFATNALTIAVPVGNPAEVTGVDDLADPDLLVGLCAAGVPCGDAARTALDRAGVQAEVLAAVDTEEGDVRALLTKIAVGELDAGIVYVTDVATSDEVEAVALPASAQVVVAYPIAVLSGASNPSGAQAFVDYVQSAAGQETFRDHGFGTP